MEYAGPKSKKHGIENSVVAYRNLMFAADNDGKSSAGTRRPCRCSG